MSSNSKKKQKRGKIIFHKHFKETVKMIKNADFQLVNDPTNDDFDFSSYTFPPNGIIEILKDEKLTSYNLDAKNGAKIAENFFFAGYDESFLTFDSLQGQVKATCHSLAISDKSDYLPICMPTLYLYTRSQMVKEGIEKENENVGGVVVTQDLGKQGNTDYLEDRDDFIKQSELSNYILFIDGPLIGGNKTFGTIKFVKDLHDSNTLPIFFVKNSSSNLIVEYIKELKNKFHSDLHWAWEVMKKGAQRTCFFTYTDQTNTDQAKVFCYLKAFKKKTPQRIELYVDTEKLMKQKKFNIGINDLMDLIYYLILVNGEVECPQIRPIAIAEKYAREILKMQNFYKELKFYGLTPTSNQDRGFMS